MRDLPEPFHHTTRDMLQRAAVEVERCEVILRSIETAVSPMIAAHHTPGGSHALQDIDLLGQSLADIATCLAGLAREVDGACEVDIRQMLAPLRLDALFQRLGGQVATPLRPEERVALF